MRSFILSCTVLSLLAPAADADMFDLFDDLQPVSTILNNSTTEFDFGGDTCCTDSTCCTANCGASCSIATGYDGQKPGWYASTDYVHMWRERTGSDFAILSSLGLSNRLIPLYSDSDLDGQNAPGFDTRVGYDGGCGHGWEFRGLWLDDFESNDTVVTAGINYANVTIFGSPGTLVDVQAMSQFQSFEVLGTLPLHDFQFSYGFRYASLDELFSFHEPFMGTSAFDTENDLYGFQIGVDGPLWECGEKFRILGNAKVGVYHNEVQTNYRGEFFLFDNASNDDENTAFLSEIGLTSVYDLSSRLSLRVGYRMLYLDAVALATEQVPRSIFVSDPTIVGNGTSSLILHGLHVGAEYRF